MLPALPGIPLLVASGSIKVLRSDYEGVKRLVDTIDAPGREPPGERRQRWLALECLETQLAALGRLGRPLGGLAGLPRGK